jgi:uncharacterized protein (DUF1778 family)
MRWKSVTKFIMQSIQQQASFKVLKDGRLYYMAKGSIDAYLSKIERALLLAAAQPLD